ncbi:MAG TPA: VOC family protein [Solirubrobacteraceae bacterium]|nr:VOC family protein [Solirubrobacteraceae bacterium]
MINRLSHVEVAVTDLGRAREFYCDVLGFEVFTESADALWLRAPAEFDVWSLKLCAERSHGLLAFGFRVDREEALDELAELHDQLGAPYRWRLAGEEPGRGRMLRALAPSGHLIDFEHSVDEVSIRGPRGPQLPMRHTDRRRGVGLARLDHVNVRTATLSQALDYFQRRLHFSASERQIDGDGKVQRAWLRRSPGSHDMAIGRDARLGFHHLAYTLRDTAAVISAADLLSDANLPVIEYGPGRHGITDACFLYIRDPDGNRIELYAGDYVRDLDRPAFDWTLEEYETTGLLWWGHQPPASFLAAGPVLERPLGALQEIGGS